MKKAYINPNSKLIQLSAEESLLATVSSGSDGNNETPEGFGGMGGDNTGGDYTGDLTRHQSIWDYWKD